MINATLQVGAVEQELTVSAAAPIIDTVDLLRRPGGQHRRRRAHAAQRPQFLAAHRADPRRHLQARRPGHAHRRQFDPLLRRRRQRQRRRHNQTGWFLDGAFITEMQTGGTLIQPNVDALQEFKVQGGNMDAEYGHTPNAINATMRSGNNQFHGTLFEFLRNSAFDARNFFYLPPAGSTQTKDPLRRNEYGFTFGGPIVKNKTFFFADLEKTGLLQGVDFNNVVPSPALRRRQLQLSGDRGQAADRSADPPALRRQRHPARAAFRRRRCSS